MTIEGTHNHQRDQIQSNTIHEVNALCQIAAQHIAQREYSQALNVYQQAATISSQCITAYVGMADLFRLHGDHNRALQALRHALKVEPENSLVRRRMASLLAGLTPTRFNPELERDLLLCINEPDLDHQQLARVIGTHLAHKYPLSHTATLATISADKLQSLNDDRLLLTYLTQCINTNAALEQWLSVLRQCLLLIGDSNGHQALICAIALQCFANEYLFSISTEEDDYLISLNHDVSTEGKAITLPQVLLMSMYQPLISITPSVDFSEHSQHDFLALLIKRTQTNLLQEQQHQTNFRKIGRIADEKNGDKTARNESSSISDLVRNQYEENPYPRWQIPPAPTPIPLAKFLQQLFGTKRTTLPTENISVLVAGCGTGFEPIELARLDKNASITALDLSSKSLAYAKRMADELKISTVSFVQGNILDAEKLDAHFDLINSTGVLHHMEDPTLGWKTLCGILKPDGIMRISLYSELARQRIVLAHQWINELQLGSTNDDIRTFRRYVFSQPANSPLAELAQSDDFYSLSGCRDLLFHVQEHRFTLLQLHTIIVELGLTVIGFDVPAWAQKKFNQHHPDSSETLDLTKWHEFEVHHPDTFVGMYQLWLQKNSPAD